MPTYEYACRACGEHLEVVQSFRDDPLTTCPGCAGELRKVFSAAGIIFKGSGWHIKDYGSGSARRGAESEGSSSEGSASEGSSSQGSSDGGGSGSGSDSGSGSGSGGGSGSGSSGSGSGSSSTSSAESA